MASSRSFLAYSSPCSFSAMRRSSRAWLKLACRARNTSSTAWVSPSARSALVDRPTIRIAVSASSMTSIWLSSSSSETSQPSRSRTSRRRLGEIAASTNASGVGFARSRSSSGVPSYKSSAEDSKVCGTKNNPSSANEDAIRNALSKRLRWSRTIHSKRRGSTGKPGRRGFSADASSFSKSYVASSKSRPVLP